MPTQKNTLTIKPIPPEILKMRTSRDAWDEIFLLQAYAAATQSHCQSLKVGAVIVKDGRTISTGINGTPGGCTNCDQLFPPRTSPDFDREEHHKFSLQHEIHAEMNALLFLCREGGVSVRGATLYCTNQPCNDCLKNIIQSGISGIVYAEAYDKANYDEWTKEFLVQRNIKMNHKPLTWQSPIIMSLLQRIPQK